VPVYKRKQKEETVKDCFLKNGYFHIRDKRGLSIEFDEEPIKKLRIVT